MPVTPHILWPGFAAVGMLVPACLDGNLRIVVTAEDAYTESIYEEMGGDLTLTLFHMAEEPKSCEVLPETYNVITEVSHGLYARLDVEVPAGWTCGESWGHSYAGGETPDEDEAYEAYICNGFLEPFEVPERGNADKAALVVTCYVDDWEGA